jgi:UPF0755 protein
MTHEDTPAKSSAKDASGVDRLLSRFGPVADENPEREAPGPRPSAASVKRPDRGPSLEAAAIATAVASTATIDAPSPLFDEPRDDVFGDPAVAEGVWTDPSASVFEEVSAEPLGPVEAIDRRDWARMPRRTGPVFRFLLVGFVLVIGISFVYGRVTTWFDDQYDPPGDPGSSVEFAIPSGATSNDVTQQLYADDVIANPTLFRYWLGDNLDGDFQAGDYICVQENMSFEEVLGCLDGIGPVPPRFFSVTIPEGLRLEDIIDVLNAENPGWAKVDLLADLQATLVSVGLTGVPDGPIPGSPDRTRSGKEGLLFPATYQVDEKNETDTLDILRRMADTMELKYTQVVEDSGKAEIIDELELTDYEVLTIASLIEEEYLIDEDLGRISRVIYNRLAHGRFPLGIDATSCYAAHKACADLTQADLDSASPWNTRDLGNYDLPPTPIASPGEKAILAALNPEPGEWLYYVRTEADGGHTFATTDEEFNAAKAVCIERGYC